VKKYTHNSTTPGGTQAPSTPVDIQGVPLTTEQTKQIHDTLLVGRSISWTTKNSTPPLGEVKPPPVGTTLKREGGRHHTVEYRLSLVYPNQIKLDQI